MSQNAQLDEKSSNIKSEQKHRQKNVKGNNTQKFNLTQDRKIIRELKHWQKRTNRRQIFFSKFGGFRWLLLLSVG